MFNIGKLRTGASRYYTDAVADNQTDYYFGHGEAAGRWVGSLARDLSLEGQRVEAEQLERLLQGLHPLTGEELLSAQGSNARARSRRPPEQPEPGVAGEALDVAQVAAQLEVTPRTVQRWLDAGRTVWAKTESAIREPLTSPADVQERLAQLERDGTTPEDLPRRYLLGVETDPSRDSKRGRPGWTVPQTEVDRLRRQRKPPPAQAGWDLVFRPPKSYSVLWAVGGNGLGDAVHTIHHEAVQAALAYLEDAAVRARVTVGSGRGRTRVRAETRGLVAAAFDHRDSRAGDPLLHTHCVVANLTRLPGGRHLAMDPRGLYRHGLAADAVYQATFRHLAERRLGLVSEPVVNGWADVQGVPREVIDHFSKRSAEIAAETARVGSDSARAREAAALATRDPKNPDRDPVGLHDRWAQEAAALGFDSKALAACLGRTAGRDLTERQIEALFDRLGGPSGLTETAATFDRSQVIRSLAGVLGGSVDGPGLVRLADRFLASDRVVPLSEHRPGQPRARVLDGAGRVVGDLGSAPFTTPEIAAIEARLIHLATGATTASGPSVGAQQVEQVLAARPKLTGEQRTMVTAVCESAAAVRPVVGYPGAGKTYAMEAAVAAFKEAGVPVLGCAVTAEAAEELAHSTGLSSDTGVLGCDTIARVLLDLDHPEFGGLPPGTAVIVDEASTVSHRDLDRLATHVERAGGTVVLLGDPKQHSAVGPGHFFGWLVNRPGGAVATLEENLRQRDVVADDGAVVVSLAEERLANVEYREGKIAEALARRDRAGNVVRAATAAELYDAMAADWFVGWQEGSRDPMIATRNSVRAELNARARLLRRASGELDGPSLEAGQAEFAEGEYVVTRKNDRWLRSATDSGWYVKNGSRGTVVDVDAERGDLVVDFDGHRGATHRVRLPHRYVAAGHVEWAYAVTDYGVQGRTLERSRAVLDDTTSAEGAYVATTRGRLENRVYIVDGAAAEAGDPDLIHTAPAERETSLETLADHLAGRSPDALVHELDPFAADSAALARRHRLDALEAALARVEERLHSGPPKVDRRVTGTEARRDQLLARRRALLTRHRALTGPGYDPRRATVTPDIVGRVELDLAEVDTTLRLLDRRLEGLHATEAEREAFLTAHGDDRQLLELLRDAVAARETRVRLAAPGLLPARVRSRLPDPGPDAHREVRRRWREAVERAALYHDRWRPEPHPLHVGQDGRADWGLGPRPSDPAAAAEWDATVTALTELAEAARSAADPGAEPISDPILEGAQHGH